MNFICSKIWLWPILGVISAILCRHYYWKLFGTYRNREFFLMITTGFLSISAWVLLLVSVVVNIMRLRM